MTVRLLAGLLGGLLLAALALPATAQQPSFDCRKARLPTEKLICADSQLARLDFHLGRVYSDAHNAQPAAGRATLYREQLAWLKRRNVECRVQADFSSDEIMASQRTQCLRVWTLARIVVLAGRYREATGADHPVASRLARDLLAPGTR